MLAKAEKFPVPFYEEQRKDIKSLIEKKSDLGVDELALKPDTNLDGYVGIFYSKLSPYYFAYTASKGFYYRPAKDVDSARITYSDLMDKEAKLSVDQRREESLEALERWSLGMAKSLGFVEGETWAIKALPKKAPEAPKAKQAPKMTDAGSKKAGKGGQTRYGYKAQGKEQTQKPPAVPKPTPSPQKKEAGGDVSPADPEPVKFVDPTKFAALLQTTGEVLRRVAKKFQGNPKLGAKKGFIRFFQVKFKGLLEKHSIQSDYLGMLYDSLINPHPAV